MSENRDFDFKSGAKSERLDIREAVMSFTRRRGDFGLRIPFPGVAFAAFFIKRDSDEEIKT